MGDLTVPTLADTAFLPELVQEVVGDHGTQLMSDGEVEGQSGQGDCRCSRKF